MQFTTAICVVDEICKQGMCDVASMLVNHQYITSRISNGFHFMFLSLAIRRKPNDTHKNDKSIVDAHKCRCVFVGGGIRYDIHFMYFKRNFLTHSFLLEWNEWWEKFYYSFRLK